MYTCRYVYMYTHVCFCVCLYTFICACICAYLLVCIPSCVLTCVYVYMCLCSCIDLSLYIRCVCAVNFIQDTVYRQKVFKYKEKKSLWRICEYFHKDNKILHLAHCFQWFLNLKERQKNLLNSDQNKKGNSLVSFSSRVLVFQIPLW